MLRCFFSCFEFFYFYVKELHDYLFKKVFIAMVSQLIMKRIRFRKNFQRKFLKEVLGKINCPSLRELINRGFDVSYSALKNYFNESRSLPEDFFMDLCYLARINANSLKIRYLDENWGQVKGGKVKKKKKKWSHQESNLGLIQVRDVS